MSVGNSKTTFLGYWNGRWHMGVARRDCREAMARHIDWLEDENRKMRATLRDRALKQE